VIGNSQTFFEIHRETALSRSKKY
ncbi:hypothetical protein LCGC14_1468850, partial [marine sediment metagenome]